MLYYDKNDEKERKRRTEFGLRLKKLRISKALKKNEMAKMLSISPAGYAWYETGNREPSIETLNALAAFFNVSIDFLVNGDQDEFSKVKTFWESAHYEVSSINDGMIQLTLPQGNIARVTNENIVTYSLNRTTVFKDKEAFIRFTQDIFSDFVIKSQKLKEAMCETALNNLHKNSVE